ncbi:LacI family DNA-binding transcriptional regulator [Microbacterium sp. Mu-80]|uniref:LacI family DNA-binding transcriptional regulator n=1 Tax=Microbacterium bandirmense TaxID=3122050 RepID=A0ABU8L9G7_9MICO
MAKPSDESADATGRPTMKDVAAHAGVGLSTVSRVVSGSTGVSRAKRQSVERSIAALGYSRNDFAHTLRTGSARTIGVAVTRISDPFYAQIIEAVESRAQERDLLVLVASAGDDPAEGEQVLRRMLSRRLDGLIVVAPEESDMGFLAPERAVGTPIVFVDRHLFALFLSDANQGPVSLSLVNLSQGAQLSNYGASMAGALIASLPTLLVYIILGKYFIGGLMSGSVKS